MSGKFDIVDATVQALTEGVEWNYFDKFREVIDKYLPDEGEGNTQASQIVTAINKLIYKWYNDGDVFDNSYNLAGWANDLSSYANWLYNYVKGANLYLDDIKDATSDSDYENILKELADRYLADYYLEAAERNPKRGSIYDCEGPYKFEEFDDEDDYDQDYETDELDESKNKKSGYIIFIKDDPEGYSYQGNGGRSRVRLDMLDALDVYDTIERAQKEVDTYKHPKRIKIMKFDGKNAINLEESKEIL